MKNVQMRVDAVKNRVRENRTTHEETYKQAVVEFKRQQVEKLKELLATAEAGDEINARELFMPVPESHLNDYDVALDMLDLEVRDEVTLTDTEFRQYVRDEWDWKHQWNNSTANYAAASLNSRA